MKPKKPKIIDAFKRDRAIAAKHTSPNVLASFLAPSEREQITRLIEDSVAALLEVFAKHFPNGTTNTATIAMWLANLPVMMVEIAVEGLPAEVRNLLLDSLARTIPAMVEDKLGERSDG